MKKGHNFLLGSFSFLLTLFVIMPLLRWAGVPMFDELLVRWFGEPTVWSKIIVVIVCVLIVCIVILTFRNKKKK